MYLLDDEFMDMGIDFTNWDDELGHQLVDEFLEQTLAQENSAQLARELEQDEQPIDYESELETEEEEAAPVSEKRLKREIQAEAIRRLEEAARTEADFSVVISEWDRLGSKPGSVGNGITRTCVGIYRWNTRRFQIQISFLDG